MCRCCGCQPALPELTPTFWLGILALTCRVVFLVTEFRLLRALLEGLTAAILILGSVGWASFTLAKGGADVRRAVATAADEVGQPPVAVPVRPHGD